MPEAAVQIEWGKGLDKDANAIRFTVEIKERADFFRCVITDETDPPMHIAVKSETFTDKQTRRLALDTLFYAIPYVIRKRAFPKDTKIWANGRYPED